MRDDGSRVEQQRDAPPVGNADDHLLGPQHLAGAQRLHDRELPQRDHPPVGPPEGHRGEQVLGRLAGAEQAVDDPHGLPVQGLRGSRDGVEDHHAHRGGVYEGLEVGPGPPFLPVPASIGDGHGRLGGEEHQRLFVLPRELPAVLFMAQVDRADSNPPMADRSHQQGGQRHGGHEVRHAQFSQVAVDIRDPQRLGKAAEVLEESQPFRHVPQPLVLLPGHTGDDEIGRLGAISNDGDRPVARGGERPCTVHHTLQHGVEVEVFGDAKTGLAQAREALLQLAYPSVSIARSVQVVTSL